MIAEFGRLGKKSAGLVYRPGGVQGYDRIIHTPTGTGSQPDLHTCLGQRRFSRVVCTDLLLGCAGMATPLFHPRRTLGRTGLMATRLGCGLQEARWSSGCRVFVSTSHRSRTSSWSAKPAIGVKGMGELGMVSIPAAIANAVFHATGRRIRELPITLDKLL